MIFIIHTKIFIFHIPFFYQIQPNIAIIFVFFFRLFWARMFFSLFRRSLFAIVTHLLLWLLLPWLSLTKKGRKRNRSNAYKRIERKKNCLETRPEIISKWTMNENLNIFLFGVFRLSSVWLILVIRKHILYFYDDGHAYYNKWKSPGHRKYIQAWTHSHDDCLL